MSSDSVLDSFLFLRKTLYKIRSREWKGETGTALAQTAAILEDCSTSKVIVAVLGGALCMGSSILNGVASTDDLKQEHKELHHAKSHFTGGGKGGDRCRATIKLQFLKIKKQIEQKVRSVK